MSKKIFATITSIATAVMLLGPVAPMARAADDLEGLTAELEQLCQTYYDLAGEVYPGCEDYVDVGEPTPTPSEYEGIPDGFTFENNLKYGMSGTEVQYLQIMLKVEVGPPTYPDSVGATGWFGPITKASVIEFQEMYATDVLAPWGLTNGTGFVGQTTRAKLNELLAAEVAPPEPGDFDNEADCEEAGYYWYNDTCNAEQQPATDFDNEADCEDAGYYWYDDACHASEQPASDFDNQADCEDAGYYWYDEACHEEEQQPAGEGELNISLSDDNPASATIIADTTSGDGAQSLIPFLSLDFENNGDSDVVIETLAFTRNGISSDTDLSQLYLYEGSTLLAEYSSFSDKIATFNDSGGLFTVEQGETMTVTLKGDIANGTGASKTIGFDLVDEDDVVSDADSMDGAFPFEGNLMTTATVSDLGKLTATSSNYNASPNPGETDYELWEFKLTATDQDIEISKLVFTNVGSTDDDDLQNLKLVANDGTQYGATLDELDGGKASFDLSDDPIAMEKGDSQYYSLRGDIVGGTNRTYRFSFQNMYDIVVKDTEYGVYLKPNQSDSWSIVQAGGASTIQTGTLTISRSSDSPSGNAALDATNVNVAKFDLTATGEDIKITSLDVYVTVSGSTTGLDNVKLYLDGVQKDQTRDITGNGSGNATTFSFGNTFVVPVGETSELLIKSDIKDASASSFSAGDTLQVRLAAGSSNAQGKTSLSSISTTAADGLTLTVQSGNLTSAKNNALPNFSASSPAGVPGSTGVLVGSFTVTAGAGEGVDISAVKIGDTSSAFGNLQNIVVKTDGGTQVGNTRGTVSAGNSYYFYPSPKISLDAGEQEVFNVYADILTGASTGQQGSVDMDEVRGTGQETASSANDTNSRTGQTIYIASTGGLTVTKAADSPVSAMLAMGDTEQTLAKFEFRETSGGEDVTVSDLTLTETGGAATADVLYIKIYDGSTLLGEKADVGSSGEVTYNGINWQIPASGTKYLTVKADVNVYGVASSGSDIVFRIDSGDVTARGETSGTAISGVPSATSTGNTFEIWKAVPTITTSGVSIDGRTLTSGSNDLYKFQISADSGTVDFYQWKFTFATSGVNAAGTWKLYNNTDGEYEDSSCSVSGTVVTCQASGGEEIADAQTKTYTVKNTNITGVDTAGDSISVYMNSDTSSVSSVGTASSTAASYNIVWSDEANTSHSTSTADWTNGYLLENDDEYTETQTSAK